jgi:hypothetical protein
MAPSTKNENKTMLLPMTLINRFERNCGTFRRGGRKNPLSSTTFINRLERSCGTFKGGGRKNPLSSMTLGQFAQKHLINHLFTYFKKNNDHGVDVNIIIVI